MKWREKEISALSNDELIEAIHSVGGMDGYRVDKLASPRKRHQKIFDKHPPVENPAFVQLATELNNEYKSRNLKEI